MNSRNTAEESICFTFQIFTRNLVKISNGCIIEMDFSVRVDFIWTFELCSVTWTVFLGWIQYWNNKWSNLVALICREERLGEFQGAVSGKFWTVAKFHTPILRARSFFVSFVCLLLSDMPTSTPQESIFLIQFADDTVGNSLGMKVVTRKPRSLHFTFLNENWTNTESLPHARSLGESLLCGKKFFLIYYARCLRELVGIDIHRNKQRGLGEQMGIKLLVSELLNFFLR